MFCFLETFQRGHFSPSFASWAALPCILHPTLCGLPQSPPRTRPVPAGTETSSCLLSVWYGAHLPCNEHSHKENAPLMFSRPRASAAVIHAYARAPARIKTALGTEDEQSLPSRSNILLVENQPLPDVLIKPIFSCFLAKPPCSSYGS